MMKDCRNLKFKIAPMYNKQMRDLLFNVAGTFNRSRYRGSARHTVCIDGFEWTTFANGTIELTVRVATGKTFWWKHLDFSTNLTHWFQRYRTADFRDVFRKLNHWQVKSS